MAGFEKLKQNIVQKPSFEFSRKKKKQNRYAVLKPDKKPGTILIHGCPFIITINQNDKLEILKNHSIYIENGLIKEIFPASDRKFINLEKVDLIYDAEQRGGIVVTPGFVNAHTHPPMYLLRSTLTFEESNLKNSLKGMSRLECMMTDQDFFIGALGDFTEEQKSGITTTLSHYGIFDPIEEAAKLTKQQVINALSAVSNSHPRNTPKLVEKYLKNASKYYTTPAIAIHYLARVKPAVLKQIKSLIKKYNPLFTLHLAETEWAVQECLDIHGDSPVKILEKYKILGPQVLMSHGVHLTKNDINLIKKKKAGVIHLPTSNLLHKSGIFNYALFIKLKAKDRIALGTDSVISKNRLDLLTEAFQAKMIHQKKLVSSYEELFKMMTSQGANLLGLNKVGKIAPGYKADIAFWKLKDRGFLPYDKNNPKTLVTNMITHGSRNIRDLMINGEFIISNRIHNFVNESRLLIELQEAHTKLKKKIKK